jgi:tetratricopeptide (TPR) repeat protein/TolB-like protein
MAAEVGEAVASAADDRWRRISQLYHDAQGLDGAARDAFLQSACLGDETLRVEVESLLRQNVSTDSLAAIDGVPVDPPGRLVGRQLGSYEIRSLLGSGGMGEVYAAYDPRLKREVAIKVVPATLAANPERMQRLQREARAAAALNHPNILAVYDIGADDGVPFIVMERVPGETLAGRVARGPVAPKEALDLGIQIADALATAHANGVLHRDLKPGNVMITPQGRVKVLDFGLAKVLARTPSTAGESAAHSVVTRPGQVFGTPAYMAPEQLMGGTTDARSDIYSLGAILFELVTGRRLFAGDNFLAVAMRRLAQPLPNPIDVNPLIPTAMSDLIVRCLAPAPEDRPISAAALKADLEQLRGGFSEGGERVVAPSQAPVSGRPRAARVAAWLLAVAGALTATALGVNRWLTPAIPAVEDRPVIAVLPLENVTGDVANDYIGVGVADALTTSLAKLAAVSVIPRETTRESALRTTDPGKLAREIGVNLLVQGSLQRSGERVRVDARLVRADGTIVWAGEAEGPINDLFAVQRQIADRLVDTLRVTVTGAERKQLAVPPTNNQEALEAYWRGMALLERTDAASLDQALVSFERAMVLDSRFALAHAAIGAASVKKYSATNVRQWMTRAEEAVLHALEIEPSQTQVRLSLANVYRSTGRNASAMEELRRVLADDPNNDEARRRLGSIFESEGRHVEALEQFRAAVDDRPQYWLNHDLLGLFYFRTGRLQDAVRAFTRVIELRPDSAQAFLRLGTTYQALGNYPQARQQYERAIAIAPDAAVYSNLGMMAYTEGRFQEAVRAFSEAVRLRPNRALFRRNLGDAYQQLGRGKEARVEYEEAARLTREALAVNPNDAQVMAQLAVYEAKVGRREEAERHIARALVINPLPEVLFRHAAVLSLHGDRKGALQALTEAIGKGYPVDVVRSDPDFAALGTLPEFKALTAQK